MIGLLKFMSLSKGAYVLDTRDSENNRAICIEIRIRGVRE
jgi:hypothetical protein